ncbi:hypothetical protein GCM10009616_09670 [Microlunatus lacustris]
MSGTTDKVLARGVGHYQWTAQPGEVGNFGIAGHRITQGEPFARLLELDAGDKIIVETPAAIFTYILDTSARDLTVDEQDVWVLDPVQGRRGRATEARITLTTCQDLFRSPDRSVAFGHLVSTTQK